MWATQAWFQAQSSRCYRAYPEFTKKIRGGRPLATPFLVLSTRLVFEALADVAHRLLSHELSARVEVGRRDTAVDLEIELHYGPEPLEERLLAKGTGQVARLEGFLLGRTKVEA